MDISKEIKRQWKRARFRAYQVTRTVTVGKAPDGAPIQHFQTNMRYVRLKSTPPLRRWAQSEARGGNTVAASWCRHKGIQCGR